LTPLLSGPLGALTEFKASKIPDYSVICRQTVLVTFYGLFKHDNHQRISESLFRQGLTH